MATAAELMAIAAKEVGYSRYTDPEQGSRYGRWYAAKTGSPWFGTTGVPYCAMFVSWCLDTAKVQAFGFPTAACSPTMRAARSAGRLLRIEDAREGDIVLFDWSGGGYRSGNADHVGFIRSVGASHGIAYTREGNVSGAVKDCARYFKDIVGCIRPAYDEPEEERVYAFRQIQRGDSGDEVAMAQAALNVRDGAGLLVDGEFGGITERAVKAYQRRRGIYPDGAVGAKTWPALMLA